MSKPVFSFGLKKAAPAKNPIATRRKPATFGGDDDGSEDEAPSAGAAPTNEVKVLELDDFDIDSSTPASADSARKPKPKHGGGAPPPPPRKSGTGSSKPPQVNPQFGDLSSALESRKYAQAAAEGEDPSIYDYDAVYDSLKAPPKMAAEVDKRPRYFDALQKAADVRERDRQIAEEKKLKREREAEGDEFADKEKFVTEAYKRQQEENRQLEEAEKKREEAEAKKNKNRGMAAFYKQMLDRDEQEHAAKVKAAEERAAAGPSTATDVPEEQGREKSATERAREINALGGNIVINDEGEVVDKRQLLKGGLNVAPKKKAEVQQDKVRQAAAARAGSTGVGQAKGVFAPGGKNAMRERQTRMLEAQLAETLKRSREEEEAERQKVELVAKSRKTESDISSAKERYLARKKAAEEAKKNGLAENV
ncbi:coiled-coil domain-containing protein 55-domain containing protein [Cercophora scortea]|uniref:Coiled-coil domain-containing protein 55-domain containing protein n=1 Tax=Cercophora scortea TaxID=314031 RepID=A0AAE0IXT5_9PEZI|nr:coiled-coil domain-containing protein 55-domain containing protein [Cercophora scortea]